MRTLKFINILLNFEKDFFKRYYNAFGHIIILKIFGIDKHYLKFLELDLFAKFYNILGYNIIT